MKVKPLTSSASTPRRTCVGCRSKRPQTDLVRCALTFDGNAVISRTAAGRGAWLCPEQPTCLHQAIKRRGFERAWKRQVDAAEHQSLKIAYEAMMTNMEN